MEGILKKKCMVVVWNGSNHTITVPKLFKYIVRYFFITGDCLCYTKTKKDHDSHKPYKVLIDLTSVVALHVFDNKMEVVVDGGKHIVLKSRDEKDIKKWVPALAARLLPKMDAIVIPAPILPLPPAPESPHSPHSPHTMHHSNSSTSIPTMFPFATTAEHPPTPPYRAPHPMLHKLPSFRSQSSLSFTLTSKQRANWFGGAGSATANFEDTNYKASPHNPGSPVRELGWDDWENIFNRFQRNEDIS
eukprot:Phypoly_transcript_14207.p1 GENE.Phypoly_transcript_14207~~Phypoly_transcript_14207.p1  ORF type:complete len:279 (+),score=48.38 Phypoly_transcript_14207:102-839(+)